MGIYSSPYKFWVYDLKIERTDERLGLAGTHLIVFRCPEKIELRLDDIRNDKIEVPACEPSNPVVISGIPFNEIWMSNKASGGFVQFIVLFGGANIQLLEELRKPKGLDRILTKIGMKI